jgi:hypothetical protein
MELSHILRKNTEDIRWILISFSSQRAVSVMLGLIHFGTLTILLVTSTFIQEMKQIKLTHYCVRARCNCNDHHLHSGRLERSNDGLSWVQTDDGNNETSLNGKGVISKFQFQKDVSTNFEWFDFDREERISMMITSSVRVRLNFSELWKNWKNQCQRHSAVNCILLSLSHFLARCCILSSFRQETNYYLDSKGCNDSSSLFGIEIMISMRLIEWWD